MQSPKAIQEAVGRRYHMYYRNYNGTVRVNLNLLSSLVLCLNLFSPVPRYILSIICLHLYLIDIYYY